MGIRERASRGWLSFAVNIVTSTGCYAAALSCVRGRGGTSAAPIASTYSVPTVVRERSGRRGREREREGDSVRAREHTATVCGRGDGGSDSGAKVEKVREGKARFAKKRLVARREFRLKIVRVVVVGVCRRRGCSVCRAA